MIRILCLALLAAALVPATASAAPGSVTLVRTSDPATWPRRSAYALGAATATAHPEWVLKDAGGRPVYLGTSLAADFGNPAYRAWWIAQASGVSRLYVDDVSMERRVFTALGYPTSVRDPRTGVTMSEASWQRYMADFMVELRTALPTAEIVHDVLWYKGDGATSIARELAAASSIAIEKGFDDPAIAAYGWEPLASFVARRQAAGRGVILDGYAEAPAARLYGLGTALLLDTGAIALGNDAWTAPTRYWTGFDVRLGAPVSTRYQWSGVWRRDFVSGSVLVNPASSAARSVSLGSGFVDLDGVPADQLTLPAAAAFVVKQRASVTTPVPPISTPVPTVTPGPVIPVATATPSPRTPVRRSGVSAHTAGAAGAKPTKTTVTLSRLGVSGRVTGAVSGYVRVSVQRRRGTAWTTVRRVKPSVSKRGTFKAAIARLSRGTFRVVATFEGTGTAVPSRSAFQRRTF